MKNVTWLINFTVNFTNVESMYLNISLSLMKRKSKEQI